MADEKREPYEYEVDLRDYINVMWNEKWIILLVFIISVGLSVGFSLSTKPKFEVKSSLIVSSKLANQIAVVPNKVPGDIPFTSDFNYKDAGLSDDLLKNIINKIDWSSDKNGPPTLDSLKKSLSIAGQYLSISEESETGESEKEDEETWKKLKIDLAVTGNTSNRVIKIANAWTNLYLQDISELLSREVNRYYELISGEYSEIQSELREKLESRLELRSEKDLYTLDIEGAALEDKYRKFLSSIESKKMELEKKRVQLKSLDSMLKTEPKYVNLERSNSGGDDDENSKDSSGVYGQKIQQINEIFVKIKERKIDAQLDISSLERELNYLESKVQELRKNIKEKRIQMEKAQFELEQINRSISGLRKTLNRLYSYMENARFIKNKEGSLVRLVEDPDTAETIRAPSTKQNVAVAGVLGLFVGILVAFFKNYMEGYNHGEVTEK
mgnify:CR=1 FL=1